MFSLFSVRVYLRKVIIKTLKNNQQTYHHQVKINDYDNWCLRKTYKNPWRQSINQKTFAQQLKRGAQKFAEATCKATFIESDDARVLFIFIIKKRAQSDL